MTASLEKSGTGGTLFRPFLKGIRDATAALRFNQRHFIYLILFCFYVFYIIIYNYIFIYF